MSQVSLALSPLLSASVCCLLLGTYSMKDVLDFIPGAGLFHSSPGQIADKYPLSMYAASWVGSTIRPLAMLWNLAGIVYVLSRTLAGEQFKDLPNSFFYSWCGAWVATIFWVFMFDSESHVMATATNAFIFFCFSRALQSGISPKPNEIDGGGKVFSILVLEGIGVAACWGFLAFAMSFALTLAYENSLHSEAAIPAGFLCMEECSTLGLIVSLLGFVIWWILDIAYFGRRTDCILSFYIVFAVVSLSIASSNYNPKEGATLNNVLSLASGILPLFAVLTRRKAKDLFLGDNHSPAKEHED